MTILEAYKNKLNVADQVYANEHGGRSLADNKKIAIARVLANTSEYITEAFEASGATQLGNMKTFKKFCLDLTTVALPSLIANDLVIVYPMKSRTGYIQYLKFQAGTAKGGVKNGEVFNDVFKLGKMTDERIDYTASAVTEDHKVTSEEATALLIDVLPVWTPAVNVKKVYVDNGTTVVEKEVVIVKDAEASTVAKAGQVNVSIAADGKTLEFKFFTGEIAANNTIKFGYLYDNVIIPQNDIPSLVAEMEGISLEAKARRIAIYYSNMAAFQAKTELGIDLGEILATQACAELTYEIDTEVVKLLIDNAGEVAVSWNERIPYGVSKRDHYAGFAETLEDGSAVLYERTQKHNANYMICNRKLINKLVMMDGWKAASGTKVNGPYYAGEINGIKVYVSPIVKKDEFVLGYNGGDMVTSAAVYAPYMAIVPTQLLGFADGGMQQGFSTMYDLKMLNDLLLVRGKITDKSEIVETHQNA